MGQRGTPLRIPLTVDLHIEAFSGGVVTRMNSGATNVVFDQYGDGTWYVTQRPGVNQLEDASATTSDARGRGAYFWDTVSQKYIVNNDTVYKSGYSGTPMTISEGIDRVFIGQCSNYLVIIDTENNEGWLIDSASSTTATKLTVANFAASGAFPPNQTPALTLCRGGCVLNGKVYVMTTAGDIYESDVDDPTTWQALSFRNAELEPDNGVYLTKHHENVVAFGTRSLEFFQDAGNPTGSTLNPRLDVSYEVGCIDGDVVWTIGDRLYFVGQDASGSVGVYTLNNFTLEKISGEDLDTFLTSAVTTDMMTVTASGMVSGGREYFVLTLSNEVTDLVPVSTLVYVSNRKWWGFWDLQIPGVDFFPLMAWMPSTSTRAGEGILINGDLLTMSDDFNPIDAVNPGSVFESGVFEPGVFTAISASGTTIPFTIITGQYDGGSPRRKFMGDLWLNHTPISVAENVSISWADEQNSTYGTAVDIDASDAESRINRMGSFRKRNFKVEGDLSEQIRMESLQGTVRQGQK